MNDKPYPGQPCPTPACDGHLRIYSGRDLKAFRIQFLHCPQCGHRPANNKLLTPIERIRRRKPRA